MNRACLLVFSLYLLVFPAKGVAQVNVTISGNVTGGAGKEVELYRYSDQLTLAEVSVDHAVIAENGHFELHAYANYPTLVVLQIERYSQSFFVEPGREYQVFVPTFDWNMDEHHNVYLDPQVLPLEFLNMPEDDLNALVTNYESVTAEYIASHQVYFDPRYRPQKRYFDTLVQLVNRKAPDTKNEYFNRYKRYQLAQFKYSMHFDTRRHMMATYVTGQPILYYDDNYMSFFFTLFAHSVSGGTRKLPAWKLGQWVNSLQLDTMLDSLGLDTLLRNERVRELVAIQALQEAYHMRQYYEPEKVAGMVAKIAERSKFSEHRTLARQLLETFEGQDRGSEVPSFTLPDVDKNMVSLDSLRGKWVYLSFVRVGDPNSIAEIETLAHFKDSVYAHNPDVAFVSVCCDREFQKMYHFLRNSKKGRKYTWTWLHFNGNYKLLERYGVVSYPHFILINPEGQLQYAVTPPPASGFLLHAPWQQAATNGNKQDSDVPFFLR